MIAVRILNIDWQRPKHILPDDLLENVRLLRILVPVNQSTWKIRRDTYDEGWGY
jgi:hypothetical protein